MTNPVSLIVAGFGPEAAFEGRIVAELERLEQGGALRVVDLLFVRRDADSGALETRAGIPGRPSVVSQADVDEVSGRRSVRRVAVLRGHQHPAPLAHATDGRSRARLHAVPRELDLDRHVPGQPVGVGVRSSFG
jgi:hypothetical protein